MRRQISLSFIICHLSFSPAGAQASWTMRQCVQYAVEHNHEMRHAELELDNHKANQTLAVGRFLPEVGAGIGAQYNFGRAIDPETNGYTDVSTFYNGYSVQASLPVFDGFSRIHALRAAKASVLMGREALRVQQDQTALAVLQAFVNVAYYEGLVRMAGEKVEEAAQLLRQTRLLETVGRKTLADVLLMESQQAEAAYELLCQQNRMASAMLELKKEMAFPMGDSLSVDISSDQSGRFLGASSQLGPSKQTVSLRQSHPELLASYHAMRAKRYEWLQARGSWLPSLSLSAGQNTTYFHTMHTADATPFRQQLRNNMGQYVGATLNIPIFSRLQTLTSMRRARNNYLMAQDAYEEKRQELEKLQREAWQDWQGCRLQTVQMEKKVEADSLACQLVRRQYEEGLSTAIDVRTISVQLLQSRATLLQCRLTGIVKECLVHYYAGEKIWE